MVKAEGQSFDKIITCDFINYLFHRRKSQVRQTVIDYLEGYLIIIIPFIPSIFVVVT